MNQAQSTRCPHCHTAFRVTPEQLAVARGSVRCGSCLEVFNAQAHMLTAEPSGGAPLTSRSDHWSDPGLPDQATDSLGKREPAPARDTTSAASSEASPAFQEAPPAPETTSSFAEDDDDDFLFRVDDEDDLVFIDDDEPPEPENQIEASDTMEFSDTFLSLDESGALGDGKPDSLEPAQDHSSTGSAAADDSWALDMLADMEKEEAAQQPRSHEKMALAEPASTAPLPHADAAQQPQRSRTAGTRSQSALERERRQLEAAFSDHDLDDWETEPAHPAGSGRLWWLAAVMLVVAVASQLLWWERESLSQQPALRGLYITTCELVGCTPPDATPDAGTIRALSSVLRPLADGRMQLDAVFVNRSDRAAPYPALLLEVQDFQGRVTADGLFLPEDYIGGEVRPGDLMPPGRPVSISINMNRPVAELNNFRLTFHY